MFSKITNCQYLWERLSYFVYLLHVVTHPGKLKFFEITNHQYLWKGLSDFVDFCVQLFESCRISIEATEIYYFGLALSGMGSQTIKLSDVLNLKT